MGKLQADLPREAPNYPDQTVRLIMGIPPSVNHCFMNLRGGGKRLTKDAEKWMARTRASVIAQLEDQGFKGEKNDVWWIVEMTFFFPDRRIRDSHNTMKVLFDSIEGTFFNNDYFILPRVMKCHLDRLDPRLEIIAYPQEPKEGDIVS